MNNDRERKASIKKLENLAAEVLKLKQERKLRRSLLIEFCGSPKSGKSTTITSLNLFLKRNGFKTVVLTERASVCPIKNKTHPFFNMWTLTSVVAEIIEHLDNREVDIIICDRGLYDALCWFEWLNNNPSTDSPYLDNETYKHLSQFIKMDIWKKSLDLIYVFQVDPETSIKREYANLLTDKRGSIMKEPVLEGFNNAINQTLKKNSLYRNLKRIKTDTQENNENPNIVSYEVTQNVLKVLENYLIEKIAFFDEKLSLELVTGINSIEILGKHKLEFGNRKQIEKSNKMQPISIAVITNKSRDKVLLVKKSKARTSKDSPERDKSLLYIGGHGRIEDLKDSKSILPTLQETLHREINEEIGESISIENKTPFLIYTPDNEKSKKHLAICYVIEMDLKDKKFKLTSDEFIMKTGTSKSGRVLSIKEIVDTEFSNLESWSKEILKEVFKTSIEQTKLFD